MKYRNDFVTNSSSSSFILNFRNEDEAYASVCRAFLNCADHDDNDYDQPFALDRIISEMKKNETDKESAVNNYLEENWYSVRYKIEEAYRRDEEKYPRKDWEDFRQRYDAEIEKETDKQIKEIRSDIEKRFAKKHYFSIVEFEDHYPEMYASMVCESLPDVLIISHH